MKKTILIIIFLLFPIQFISASSTQGTIDSTYKYAWGENTGWINFGCTNCNVSITDSVITGYVWSTNYGWINLNPTNSGVTNNGNGVLSGYAWGENTGWINFTGVIIDSDGYFSGYANGDITGQISFNCSNTDSCENSNFKIRTDWRPQNSRPACNNSLDDDGDGLIDYPNDLGCESISDNDETNVNSGGVSILPPSSTGTGVNNTSIPMNASSDVGVIDSKGNNLLMYINSEANFSIPTSRSGNQNHSLNIVDLDLLNNKVTIVINSDPITLTLDLDETKYVDLDGDGINDLEVKFEDLVINRAEITVKSINGNKNIWTNGRWVKIEDNSAIYLVDQDNIRHAYPNQKVWNSYFENDFSFVETISNTELTSYNLGRNIPYNTDSLFKIPSVPKVYVVTKDNKVKWIKTEQIAIDLYGNEWNKLVHDLPEVFWNDYVLEEEIE